ncbi:flagellar biosynthetic protein FliR [Acinetobacter baumannii]|uniref:flagellar biosynthetic protein FliR n=1 Tax=Acinetobacter baumannii TaxID=470 RepID=UPI0004532620|nr:flagellar biosynthetic protein FliR [Acinetobacter baumannii]EXR82157.1 bacterial export s, 1 family protein [Acinetobacter baumannii 541915]MDH2549157.1 flagellar biosynthetic protein FliR [Acinetobacter baumannii]MDH2643920.1 flagellar biosynthetic protein FliR [Acinetobacter baumannii]MDH2650955.1 flagellar biosynthetic protein FliR [Acinetobacter baumannii]MDV7634518.1 flagellar biosynthetic protein FliR [Acinetobacter baumannii]
MFGFLEFTTVLLLSLRLLPIFVVMPLTIFTRAPIFFRLIIVLAIAVILSGLVPIEHRVITIPLIISEFLLGIVLAFGFHTAFASLDLVGKLLDLQIGINTAGVFDPSSSHLNGVISDLLIAIAGVLFFILNLHYTLLNGLVALFRVIPLGSFNFQLLNIKKLVSLMGEQFIFAFIILLPVILGVWLVDIAFAIMSRSMPQANIYFLALPVKFIAGLVLLMLAMPMIVQNIPRLFDEPLKLILF